MKQEILLKHKIGWRLSRIGVLSKVFAIQAYAKENFDISPEQFTVLITLRENNGMYMRQIANITFKDRPNMTRIVAILESKGYLSSVLESEGGRQVKKLYITDKGKNICESMIPTILSVWNTIVEDIDEEEIDKFLVTLDKLEENLRKNTILQN